MSQVLLSGHLNKLPYILMHSVSNTFTGITLNAAGETMNMIGSIILENPLGGSKTISAAGGGSIVWRTGASTFAHAGSSLDVGIQDVSSSTSVAQGDGTFDVKATYAGGSGIVANSTITSVMTSGSKTISHGQLVAITFAMTARGDAIDSVIVNANNQHSHSGPTPLRPTVTENTSGTFSRTGSSLPNAYLIFDDGSVGWFFGSPFVSSLANLQTYNSGTAVADEYGNLIRSPGAFMAMGFETVMTVANASADFEVVVYSDPLTTPVIERTLTVDATQVSAINSNARFMDIFAVPLLIKPNKDYALTVRPTTTNSVSLVYGEGKDSNSGKTGYGNSNFYSVRRLDNTGSFSDYNGGTAKSRFFYVNFIGSHMEQGVNPASYRIGI